MSSLIPPKSATKAATNKYVFPILRKDELLQNCADMNVPVTEDDWLNPNPLALRQIFEQMVTLLMGVTKEDQQQPSFAALDNFAFQELHEESIPEVAFYRALYASVFILLTSEGPF
jgi:kinetochore protein Nuf2